jgi:hypothetical protein
MVKHGQDCRHSLGMGVLLSAAVLTSSMFLFAKMCLRVRYRGMHECAASCEDRSSTSQVRKMRQGVAQWQVGSLAEVGKDVVEAALTVARSRRSPSPRLPPSGTAHMGLANKPELELSNLNKYRTHDAVDLRRPKHFECDEKSYRRCLTLRKTAYRTHSRCAEIAPLIYRPMRPRSQPDTKTKKSRMTLPGLYQGLVVCFGLAPPPVGL